MFLCSHYSVAPALLVALFLLTGCHSSTVESRREEKMATYAALSPEMKQLVDGGQIRVGMPADAVYIAWGAPSEILQSETAAGLVSTWLYHGTFMQEQRYWNYREARDREGIVFLERYLETDYNPRSFVRAEIHFQNGIVKSWRTLPQPH